MAIRLAIASLLVAEPARAATYFWNGTGAIDVAANWGTNTDGSGTHPSNFTTASQLFNVQSGQSAVLQNDWAISGNSSKLTIQSGATFNTGTKVVSGGSGSFGLAGGATFITSNANGITGAVTSSSPSFNTATNFDFQGASTGLGFQGTVNNITFNNISGNTALDGNNNNFTSNGTLSVYGGVSAGMRNSITVFSTGDAVVLRNGIINSGLTVSLSGGPGGNIVFDAANNGTGTIAANLNLGVETRTINVANGSAATDMLISGPISGNDVVKAGLGTLELTNGSNGYAMGTTISSGTVLANNLSGTSVLGKGTVDIAGGILGGAGNASDSAINVKSGGTISAGTATANGVLRTGSQTWNSGGTFAVKLNTTGIDQAAGSGFDQLVMSGLTFAVSTPKFVISISSITAGGGAAFDGKSNYSWKIVDALTAISGFNTSLFSLDTSGFHGTNYVGSSNNGSSSGAFSLSLTGGDIQLNYATAAPEPTSLILFGLAVVPVFISRKNRIATGRSEAGEPSLISCESVRSASSLDSFH